MFLYAWYRQMHVGYFIDFFSSYFNYVLYICYIYTQLSRFHNEMTWVVLSLHWDLHTSFADICLTMFSLNDAHGKLQIEFEVTNWIEFSKWTNSDKKMRALVLTTLCFRGGRWKYFIQYRKYKVCGLYFMCCPPYPTVANHNGSETRWRRFDFVPNRLVENENSWAILNYRYPLCRLRNNELVNPWYRWLVNSERRVRYVMTTFLLFILLCYLVYFNNTFLTTGVAIVQSLIFT